MKKIKRMLALALAAIVMISAFAVPVSAKGFTDIYNGHPYQDAINYVSDNEIMNGITPTEFAPNNAVTRAMMVTILYRKAGSPYVTIPTTGKFTDVPDTAYYAKAVYWAKDKSITNGTSTTTFSPNQTITREQAMCFLYNYSKVTITAVNKTGSITGYSDYSNVSSYARDAMAWAVANKVLIITDPNKANLYPKHTMSRVQAAYGITAFGTNVERCVQDSDILSFLNEGSGSEGGASNTNQHFHSSFYLTPNHLNKFYNKLSKKYGSGSAYSSAVTEFRTMLSTPASGRCFGMSTVAALDKFGKINFNGIGGNLSGTMSSVSCTPKTITESDITYYHLSQALTDIGSIDTSKWSKYTNLVLDAMYYATGPSLFVFWAASPPDEISHARDVYHAVLVNSCTKSGSNYILSVYDPNTAGFDRWTLITKGEKYCFSGMPDYLEPTPGRDYGIMRSYAITDFSKFDFLDIDGYQNSKTTAISTNSLSGTSQTMSADSVEEETPWDNYPEDFSTVYFRLQEGMTITNDEGETLTWKDGELSGDMEVYGWNFITGTSPVLAYADVPLSKTFRIETAEGAQQEFSVVDKYRYQRLEDFSGTAELCGDGTMELSGSPEEFTATCFRPVNGIKHTLSGTGSQSVRLDFTGEKVIAEGLTGAYTVQHTDETGTEYATETVVEAEQSEKIPALSIAGEEAN